MGNYQIYQRDLFYFKRENVKRKDVLPDQGYFLFKKNVGSKQTRNLKVFFSVYFQVSRRKKVHTQQNWKIFNKKF